MLSRTFPNPLKFFMEICNILVIYVLCIKYSPRFIVMPCHVISAPKNAQLMWYVHQGLHYMLQYHRSQEVTYILGIYCRREEKDLPNPLTSSLLLAGVESPAGIEVSDSSTKAQEHFILHFIRT